MGPIEHAVCQIAFKIEKKYQENNSKIIRKTQRFKCSSSFHSLLKSWSKSKFDKAIFERFFWSSKKDD